MRAPLVLALLVIASPGRAFTLGCIGDSNTSTYLFDGVTPQPVVPWCDRLAARHPDWTVHNIAIATTTAVTRGVLDGAGQLGFLLFMYGAPDVVIAAFGTNDVAQPTPLPTDAIVDAYSALAATADSAGAAFLPATTPARWFPDRYRREIRALNRAMIRRFGRRGVVPFDRHVLRRELYDGLHFSDAGQERRADTAERTLFLGGFPAE